MPASRMPANRSRPWIRRVLLALAAMAGLAIAVVGWIAATFDPNAWKPALVEQVAQRYQRTLTLDGDIRISWLPSIGAQVGGISLSERAGSEEFAGAEQVRVSLAVLPLLRGRLVIREIVLRKPRATLVTRADGTRNVDDLLAPSGDVAAGGKPADPVAQDRGVGLDIGRIVVEKGRFTARDERSGQVLSLTDVDLTTGRLGGDSAEPFTLAAGVQASEPRLDLRVEARGRLLLDLPGRRQGVGALAMTASGTSADGPVEARLEAARLFIAARSIDLAALKLNLRRGDAQRSLAIELSLPSLSAVDQSFKGAPLALTVDYRSGPGTVLNLRAGTQLQGSLLADGMGLQSLEAPEIKADIEGRLSGHTVQGSARAQAASDFAGGRHALQRFSLKATLFGLDAPARDVTLALDGTATAGAGSPGALSASAEGRLNESALRGRVSREAAGAPLRFDLEADQLDVDRYRSVPPSAAASTAPAAPAVPGPRAPAASAPAPLDFGFLDGLALAGSVRVGALRLAGLRAANVRIDLRVADGRLDASPIVASLYAGRLDGSLVLVDAKPPRLAIRQQLTGVQVGPLLADAAKPALVEGRGTVRFDLSAQGASTDALVRALSGSAALELADGALRGVDIAGVLREARTRIDQLRGKETRASAGDQRTGFSELKASFKVHDGVARNTDLSMKSPLLRAGGEGAIDLGAGSIDYLLRPTIVGTLAGQGGREAADLRGVTVPVRITGPLSAPRYDFDLQAMLGGAVRQQLERRGTELLRERLGTGGGDSKPGVRPSPADLLKGVLGR